MEYAGKGTRERPTFPANETTGGMTDLQTRVARLLGGGMAEEEAHAWLLSLGFVDPAKAHSRLGQVARVLPEERAAQAFLNSLLSGLFVAANPERVLLQIERFVTRLASSPDLLHFATADPRRAEMLVTLFAGSQFLAEILLSHPEYFDELVRAQTDPRPVYRLEQQRTAIEMHQLARDAIGGCETFADQIDALRRFQRREMLRIGACDLLGLWDLTVVTTQLSHLADGLVRASLEVAAHDAGIVPAGFAVLALGKLGGRELNYSSDIDLLFLASTDPSSYNTLAVRLMDTLRVATPEGFLYRVDMRLRPWGSVGSLVSSPGGYLRYIETQARLWEKQALLKARLIAGNSIVGSEFLNEVQPHIFSSDAAEVRDDVRGIKQKIERELEKKGRGWGEVKLGRGSIRDVEFVTQYLQLIHGGEHPHVRSPQTLDALSRLLSAGLLPGDEYRVLVDGYTFLRAVEHHLQLMHYRQMHTLPQPGAELFHLARRLDFQSDDAEVQFVERYEQHCAAIRTVYQRYLEPNTALAESPSADAIGPHLERLAPAYAVTFSEEDIRRHAAMADRLRPNHLVDVSAVPLEGQSWRLTVVGYDYLGAFSLICGQLVVHGFNIVDGHIFTYEPAAGDETEKSNAREVGASRTDRRAAPRKIVDVLTVDSVRPEIEPTVWQTYADELRELVGLLKKGDLDAAQGALARRVGSTVKAGSETPRTLYPVDIAIDNDCSDRYTVLRIDAVDTFGFLYELTNALALNRIHIGRMTVESVGDRVRDTLYVTDSSGQKITDPHRQQQLRAATVLVKHFTHLLPSAPDPESSLLHFRGFLSGLLQRDDWTEEMASLERPEVLNALTQLLGVSDFLWEDFLRMQHENLFPVVTETRALARPKERDELETELAEALAAAKSEPERRDALNAYKDREMFRIDMRYILGRIGHFDRFSEELSDLAEVVVAAALDLCIEELASRHGRPLLTDGAECPVSVCALGKGGGRELGFASDIELLFVYAGQGETEGPARIASSEFYSRVVRAVADTIQAKREGIFEVDLRLRPYGSAGNLAVSLQAFERYFAPDGAAWPYERQLLIKLRPIAGDPSLGIRIQTMRDDILDAIGPFDVAAMRAMRERQVRHLVTPGTVNAKFSFGGLVDLEYLVQGLQISYFRRYADLRGLTSTREALRTLFELGVLSGEDFERLDEALTFLRTLIEALRMVRGHARDLTVPPTDSEDFSFLARRLRYESSESLWKDIHEHMADVQRLSNEHLG